jgi:hypothetical protein
MKKINVIKITLDIVMAVVFVLLFNTKAVAGQTFHEIAGLALGLAILVHLTLNGRWIRQITKNLLSKKMTLKTKTGYAVDVLLLLSVAYIIVSGIIISKVVFPGLQAGSTFFFKSTHTAASYLSLAFLGIHLGLHWQWTMGVFKRLLRIKEHNKLLSYVSKAAVIAVFITGVYFGYTINYIPRVAAIGISAGQVQSLERNAPKNDFAQGAGGSHGNSGQNGLQKNQGAGKDAAAGIPGTVATYLSITSVFAIITYYIEKLIGIKKLKRAKCDSGGTGTERRN